MDREQYTGKQERKAEVVTHFINHILLFFNIVEEVEDLSYIKFMNDMVQSTFYKAAFGTLNKWF